jgi:hypothetical protein
LPALLNAIAAALDQEEQYNNKKYACNDPDNCRIHHFGTSLLLFRVLKAVDDHQDCATGN